MQDGPLYAILTLAGYALFGWQGAVNAVSTLCWLHTYKPRDGVGKFIVRLLGAAVTSAAVILSVKQLTGQ